MRVSRRAAVGATLVLWIAGVLAAFGGLTRYSSRPGAAGKSDPEAASSLFAREGTPGRPLLVMAVHPRCPCTDASLSEMADLLARSRGACDAVLLSYRAPEWPPEAIRRNLGGVEVPVLPDPDGKLAAQLGALTSGDCLLIDPHGTVRFHGGLTVARGHRGESPAQQAILAAVHGERPLLTTAPVYGCALNSKTGCPAPGHS